MSSFTTIDSDLGNPADDTTTDTGTGFFLPPLTSQSGLPPTLVRGSWVTRDQNSIVTSTVELSTSPNTTSRIGITSTPTDLPTGNKVVVSPGSENQPRSEGGVTISKGVLGAIIGVGVILLIVVVVAVSRWLLEKEKRKWEEDLREQRRLRREAGSQIGSDSWDTSTVRQYIEPSGRRPLPQASGLRNPNRPQDGPDTRAIRFQGVKPTPSEAAQASKPISLDYLSKAKIEAMSDTVYSEESVYDSYQKKPLVNDKYRQQRSRAAARRRLDGHDVGSAADVSMFGEESIPDTGEDLFSPKKPEQYRPPLPRPTSVVRGPQSGLKPGDGLRRGPSVRSSRLKTEVTLEHVGDESFASDNLSQVDFGVDTEVPSEYMGDESRMSVDPWWDQVQKNQKDAKREQERERRLNEDRG